MTLTATLEKFKIVEMAKAAVLETPQLSKQATCQHQGTYLMNTLSDCGRAVDLSGQVFGLWTVLRHDPMRSQGARLGNAYWQCQCKCGNIKSIRLRSLQCGDSTSCGCAMPQRQAANLEGDRFGRWTVIKKDTAERFYKSGRKNTSALWLCRCDCGSEKLISSNSLLSGFSKSCGCLQSEIAKTVNKKHGLYNTRLYRIWLGIKERCLNPKNTGYSCYGGRGILICDEWRDFETFFAWASENGYSDSLTIERKDVNGNYCPENCCFISMQEQHLNKTTTVWVEAWGERRRIFEWMQDPRCKATSEALIRNRVYRGIEPERAIGQARLNENRKVNLVETEEYSH